MTTDVITEASPSGASGEALPAALSTEGLEAGYGRTTILRNVSITVPAGGAVALLGPNGAGKSTFLRTVSGLLPTTKGRVMMNGEDVTRSAPFKRFKAGLVHVPEGRGVFRGLSVRDNILLQSIPGSEAEALERAISAFPVLGSRLAQSAGTLSGGQQQMLAMAAAYVRNPRMVLVDEASLGLAPFIVDSIFEFLEGISNEGAALLVVDQFATKALAITQRVYVLRRGEVVHSGPSSEMTEAEIFDQYLGSGSH